MESNVTSREEKQELVLDGDMDEDIGILTLNKEDRHVLTKSTDPEIDSLYGKCKRGKLILNPNFQRRFVWDRLKASRLIESALLNVPLPIIYLAEEADGRESVIDGQQRLTSFFSFIDGKLPNGEIFKLTGMKVFTELEKKTYKDISEELQDKVRYYQMRAVTILNNSDPNLKFEIFERLNKGAVSLNNMELRNCLYQGSYMAFLKDLAEDPDFMQIIDIKEPDSRMRDVELVLKFAAFYHNTHLNYKSHIGAFLNNDMKKYQNISREEAEDLRNAFKKGLQIAKSLFGRNAFRRFHMGDSSKADGRWTARGVNAPLFDVLMVLFCRLDKNQVYAALDPLREALMDLIATNSEFIDAISTSTSNETRVKRRYKLASFVIDNVLENYAKQPRCFSQQLKEDLFRENPTCSICGNKIMLIDDAALDHIQQYWQGGQTIPQNARLAHRYCNLARSRTR